MIDDSECKGDIEGPSQLYYSQAEEREVKLSDGLGRFEQFAHEHTIHHEHGLPMEYD